LANTVLELNYAAKHRHFIVGLDLTQQQLTNVNTTTCNRQNYINNLLDRCLYDRGGFYFETLQAFTTDPSGPAIPHLEL
jgi:hypothetical protein